MILTKPLPSSHSLPINAEIDCNIDENHRPTHISKISKLAAIFFGGAAVGAMYVIGSVWATEKLWSSLGLSNPSTPPELLAKFKDNSLAMGNLLGITCAFITCCKNVSSPERTALDTLKMFDEQLPVDKETLEKTKWWNETNTKAQNMEAWGLGLMAGAIIKTVPHWYNMQRDSSKP